MWWSVKRQPQEEAIIDEVDKSTRSVHVNQRLPLATNAHSGHGGRDKCCTWLNNRGLSLVKANLANVTAEWLISTIAETNTESLTLRLRGPASHQGAGWLYWIFPSWREQKFLLTWCTYIVDMNSSLPMLYCQHQHPLIPRMPDPPSGCSAPALHLKEELISQQREENNGFLPVKLTHLTTSPLPLIWKALT